MQTTTEPSAAVTAQRPPLPAVGREKMHAGVRRWSAELESLGFQVRHEGRGCNLYSVVERDGIVLMPQTLGAGLYAFLLGVKAGMARK